MADNMRNRRREDRPSEYTSDNYYRRGSYSDHPHSGHGGDLDRGYSSYGATEENYRQNRPDHRNPQDQYSDWEEGAGSRNFSGSNYDHDYDFGVNRRGYGRTAGDYGNMDYRNQNAGYDRDGQEPRGFGVRSNYAYNQGGYGSNFGGEYGHYGRRSYQGEFGSGNTNRRGSGWAYGNPDERNYSSFSGRYDKNYEEAWRRDNRDWFDRAGDEVASWFGDRDAEHRRRMDHWYDQHRGKGPKGYKRTDSRIEEDHNDRLYDDSWVDASDIEVKVNNSEVVLTGQVSDRFAKRRAEDIAESIPGVTQVENRIRVNRDSSSGSTGLRSSGDRTNPDGSTRSGNIL